MSDREPLVQNSGDPRQVKAGAHKEKLLREARRRDLAHALSSAEGRRTLWRFMDEVCGLNTVDFDPNPYVSAFNQGVRKVGVILRSEIKELGPEVLSQMERESIEQEAKITHA